MKSHQWKSVPINTEGIPAEELAFLGGIEELKDYEITRPGSELSETKKRKAEKDNKENKKKLKAVAVEDTPVLASKEDDLDMSAWAKYCLHESILQGLKSVGFANPTKIQELTIPVAIRGNQDILGAAETGSGKTLAFGIPIVNSILSMKERRNNAEEEGADPVKPLYCLILTPTRELAIQIKNHLLAICKFTDIKIAVVVGGMAPEKQRRILKKKSPEIVVATPGRLWEMIDEGESHLSKISAVKYLVIDEADRMLEKNHFTELAQILPLVDKSDRNKKFVFSATLTLTHDKIFRLGKVKRKKQKLESLIGLIGMKDPKVIDITKSTAVVASLTEAQIMCSNEEKDTYLYYFILMHPGRTLIFCNSIDCVRRIRTVLELLNCNPLPLHASMQQRQRLKNLERFEKSHNGILLASDVAARGLDIKGIEHVIHFQVPRTAETYVHRSGRTARAQNEGLSLMLIEPQDVTFYKRICKTLNKDTTLPSFPVDARIFKLAKERVTVARAIDKMEHRIKRQAAENRWFENIAEAVDLDIEDENLLHNLEDQAPQSKEIKHMKKTLKALLSKPVYSKLLSGSYPTKSGKLMNKSAYNPQEALKVFKKNEKKNKIVQ